MSDFSSASLVPTSATFAEANDRTKSYIADFIDALRACPLSSTATIHDPATLLPRFERKHEGKVRDMFICADCVVLVTTDRQSAFDRQLTSVPCKGQVLNLTSLWWFQKNIVPHHVIASPHPNVTIAKRCKVFPVEFVMRAYITGSTNTSMWTHYKNHGASKSYCGHALPEGLVKNQQLVEVLLTPTTKSDEHDELTSAEAAVAAGLLTQQQWDTCAHYAHKMFAFGMEEAAKRGLILVDTKYEFGIDLSSSSSGEGDVMLVDEVHTPDSSRYWLQETYHARMAAGEEPDNIDKEFLRRWYVQHCDPYDSTAALPTAPSELVNELSRRYILIFEALTQLRFPDCCDKQPELSLRPALEAYFNQQQQQQQQEEEEVGDNRTT